MCLPISTLALAFLKALEPKDEAVTAALETMQAKGREPKKNTGFRSKKQGHSRPAAK